MRQDHIVLYINVQGHSEVPEQSKTEKGNPVLDDSSALSVQATNLHCMSDKDEEDTNDTTLSGIEQLPDNSLDSSNTEPLQENSDAEDNQEQKSRVDEKPPRPQPPKQTIISMFHAMKRKVTPGKYADLSRENLKVQRGDTSKS